MIISYEYFMKALNKRISSDDDTLNYELLVNVVKNPNRYTGIFRLSNAKTKLIQNVTQSREIKFGDFMEDILTDYIGRIGYTNLDKSIGCDENGDDLSADQVFKKDNTVYLIEQKIRDDHDSTKKRGQYANFKKKYTLLKSKYPNCKVDATMWFIDDSLVKNKNYYLQEANNERQPDITINVLYGEYLFKVLFSRVDIWEEICSYLSRNKAERTGEVLSIPDFDTSEEMLQALRRLKGEQGSLYRKLISDKPAYKQLRAELFPTGENLNKVRF